MTVRYCIGDQCVDGVYSANIQSIMLLCLVEDPMFSDPDKGDFSIQNGSPAIGFSTNGTDCGNPITNWTHVKTKVEELTFPDKPVACNLKQNYPNPFNSYTTISYTITKSDHVILEIYNVTGQKIRTLIDAVNDIGHFSVCWDGLDDQGYLATGGIYFCKLKSGSEVKSRKLLFLK